MKVSKYLKNTARWEGAVTPLWNTDILQHLWLLFWRSVCVCGDLWCVLCVMSALPVEVSCLWCHFHRVWGKKKFTEAPSMPTSAIKVSTGLSPLHLKVSRSAGIVFCLISHFLPGLHMHCLYYSTCFLALLASQWNGAWYLTVYRCQQGIFFTRTGWDATLAIN